jgi:hypothetical protein
MVGCTGTLNPVILLSIYFNTGNLENNHNKKTGAKIMKLFLMLRNIFIRIKVYMKRTTSYLSMINTAMILFLFLSNLEKYGIDIDIGQLIIPLFILGVALTILFGYIEDRLGFYKEEQRTTQSRSPYFNEIVERLDKIEKNLDKSNK